MTVILTPAFVAPRNVAMNGGAGQPHDDLVNQNRFCTQEAVAEVGFDEGVIQVMTAADTPPPIGLWHYPDNRMALSPSIPPQPYAERTTIAVTWQLPDLVGHRLGVERIALADCPPQNGARAVLIMKIADLKGKQVRIFDPQGLNGDPFVEALGTDDISRQAHTPFGAYAGAQQRPKTGCKILAIFELIV